MNLYGGGDNGAMIASDEEEVSRTLLRPLETN